MRVHVGIGSNLGDRQANILTALQRLRSQARIELVSSFFESAAAGGAEGPAFLNVAAQLETPLDRNGFESFARTVELAVGRGSTRRLAARPIDIDVLASQDYVHPQLADRPYNLVPLAEIAPQLLEPKSQRTVGELAQAFSGNGIHKRSRSLHFDANRQDEKPSVPLSLDRAGVSHVRRIVRLNVGGQEQIYNGEFTMVAELAPDRAGVHMSRFNEILEETALEVLASPQAPSRIETLTEAIAREIVRAHGTMRADVRLRAQFALERWTPVSGKRGEEHYVLTGIAHADAAGVRRAVGVEAEGMTACPCAQGMVRERSLSDLREAGFSEEDAHRALDIIPGATHNQRGRGSITIGVTSDEMPAAADLVEIVENAMSSETYDLLKRPDEFFIVNKAHRNPKFVEDVVRDILAGALEMYPDFGDDTFIAASQVNEESIHKHDAFAEAYGTFGELRAELRGAPRSSPRTDLMTWLRHR